MNHRLTLVAATATAATSVALYPLIAGIGWWWAGLGAIIVVAAVGTLTRLRVLPAIVSVVASLAGLLLYLNVLFAWRQSAGRLAPTGASLHHLASLVSAATDQMSRYAPPVPGTRPIVLLTTAGIGLTAVMADLLAVRLRRPALAGLPLLVLFCVPLTTDVRPGGLADAVTFCLAIAGFLALLSADGRERLRLWGRLVRTWHGRAETGAGPDTRPLTAAGRRIGLTAIVLAVCVPLIVPGLKQHRLFSGSASGRGGGYSGPLSLPRPLVQLNQQLREVTPQRVLIYHTDASAPPYLQVYVLGRLTTNAWSLALPRSNSTTEVGKSQLPPVPGLGPGVGAASVREQISLGATLTGGRIAVSYLPVPYAPRSVNVPGQWRVDRGSLTVLTAGAKLAGLRYTVTSKDINPTPEQLRDVPVPPPSLDGYLSMPPVFQHRLSHLAARITAGHTTAYGKAVALQNWFTKPGNFTYTLNATEPRSSSDLIGFLTQSKRGYCQQFAFAMAVLARIEGIPSRVVVGYTQGTYLGNDNWQVKTSDAHAWPELYFQGVGWLRFEPTPSGSAGHPGQATAFAPAYTFPPAPTGVPVPQPSATTQAPGSTLPSTKASPGGLTTKLSRLGGTQTGRTGHRPGRSLSLGLPLAVVLVVLLLLPRAARSISRRRRWFRATDGAQRAHAAWCELHDDLADHRIALRPSESPRAMAARVGESLDLPAASREALARVALAEERARYASTPPTSAPLHTDVATVRRAVAKASSRPARWGAILLPRSALAPVRAGAQNLLDVFGWMEVITTSLRNRAGQHRAETAVYWRN